MLEVWNHGKIVYELEDGLWEIEKDGKTLRVFDSEGAGGKVFKHGEWNGVGQDVSANGLKIGHKDDDKCSHCKKEQG